MAKIHDIYTLTATFDYGGASEVARFNFLDKPDKYLSGNGLGDDCGVAKTSGDNGVFPVTSVEELIRCPLVRRYNVSYTLNSGLASEQRKTVKVLVAADKAAAFEAKFNGLADATATIYTESATHVKANIAGVRKHTYI